MIRIRKILTFLALAPPLVAGAETLTVCERGCDHRSINAAIAAASDGDVIQLAAEVFFEGRAVNPLGKAITIRGSKNPTGDPGSILDGDTAHQLIHCLSGETSDTIFENLIIQRGAGIVGAGMWNIGSGPTILNCWFRNNLGIDYGGGMLVYSGSPILIDCKFEENSSTFAGGGMYVDDSDCVLTRCTFVRNSTGGRGGGVANLGADDFELIDCHFEDNVAVEGGGVYNYFSNPTLIDCRFEGNAFLANTGMEVGGGMYNDSSAPLLIDCTMKGNFSTHRGGGIFNYLSDPILDGCLITGNLTAGLGGGIANVKSTPTLVNSIVCANGPDEIDGGFDDAGGNHVGEECPTATCPTDLNKDGSTSGSDLGSLITTWGHCGSCPSDFNHDGFVDRIDLEVLVAAWGACDENIDG